MFTPGFYRHKNFRDIYIEVRPNGRWIGLKYSKIRVNWWNLGLTGNPWILLYNKKLKIFKEDYKNWQRLTNSDIIKLSLTRNR